MRQLLKNLQLIFYFLFVHLSISYELTYLMTALLPVIFIILFKPFTFTVSKSVIVLKFSILLTLVLMSVLSVLYKDYTLVYLPPIVISLFIFLPFSLSLRKGYTPLITKIYYLTDGKIVEQRTERRINYTNKLTVLWASVVGAILLETILLSVFASLETWSLFVNIINYALMLSLMVFEWFFRQIYFNRFNFNQWQSPIVFIKEMILLDPRLLLKKDEQALNS